MIKKINGEVCVGPVESLNHWHKHFNTVLNVRSCFSDHVLDDVGQYPIWGELDLPPSEEEVLDALSSIRGSKVGGKMECYQSCQSVVELTFWSIFLSFSSEFGVISLSPSNGMVLL